jgi:Fe-S oxidoreductase
MAGFEVSTEVEELAESDYFRVQFSGVRDVFAKRAQKNLADEAERLHDIGDVVNWSKGQIRAVAADLEREGRTPVVGGDALVYTITPAGVEKR